MKIFYVEDDARDADRKRANWPAKLRTSAWYPAKLKQGAEVHA